MEKIISIMTVLSNRRVWGSILGAASVIFSLLNIETAIDFQRLGDLMVSVFAALTALVSAGLTLWSFLRPKPPETPIVTNK
jgi:hypothetical protein